MVSGDDSGAAADAAGHASDALLAAFAHDLRSPLARLIHTSGPQAQSVDDAAQYRATVAACAREQLALLDDLLDYTRYAQTPPDVVTAPVYLFALVDELGREGRALAADSGMDIVAGCGAAAPPLVLFDGRLLRQVLRKLLAAAMRHADTASAPIVLALDAIAPVTPQGHVVLRFSVGAAQSSSAAQPVDIDGATLASGSRGALDLAIAGQLLRAAGSHLQREAAGADIGASMPRYFFDLETTVAAEADAMLPLPVCSDAAPVTGRGRRLLVVDAAPAMLDYLCEVFEHGGFDVDRADNVSEALALHGAQPYALLVCGHQPRELDAWDLLRQLGGASAPQVVLHTLTAPQRPDGFPPAPDFAAVLYRPAAPDLLLTVLTQLDGV